ncbi:MAG: folate family ECF transporter S component [Candidatus Lactobacillus pullistercoris]|uniref:Folate family ECF transporter S component n=1 Tax=Candidatus Lactobacillus pullistercoris TaxID=2838636 RepID=A0A9E2KT61_9LACO|nr:folate family ECF transporter S component [Candidatus Lactobacillus pullistercoris]
MSIKKWFEIDLQELILLGLVVAMKIVLAQFSFGPATVKVGLGFIGSVMLAYFFGPVWGAVGGGISDLLTSAIFGQQGGFFIGFTLTAMAGPLIYGLFFYHQPIKIWRIIAATLLVTIIVNIGMNTLWIHMMYGLDFRAALIQRVPKEVIVPWLQMIITYFVLEAISRVKIRK